MQRYLTSVIPRLLYFTGNPSFSIDAHATWGLLSPQALGSETRVAGLWKVVSIKAIR